ncbi:hypothetical protein K7432_014074, partial [Basidiobolus ranarum]
MKHLSLLTIGLALTFVTECYSTSVKDSKFFVQTDQTIKENVAPRNFQEPTSLVLNAHAHNDYLHPNPLFDALAQGFGSVEADIFYIRDTLLVAHEITKVSPERTLEGLYLKPLSDRVKKWGAVYRNMAKDRPFVLLIDVKHRPLDSYKALDKLLQKYQHMLTRFEGDKVEQNSITVVLTGAHDNAYIAKLSQRFVTIDATFQDTKSPSIPAKPPLFGWLSDDWSKYFTWTGKTSFSPKDIKKL